ncbi:MAG: cyclophilin-like fold protein [Thermodesulfobacteriota bacterium]|jgi:hypothetical protein
MEKKIKILINDLKVDAELNESKSAQLIWEALPIEAKINLWGEEIYFAIPVKAALEAAAKEIVSVGELGYWPTGQAFCIFFGRTPASRGDEIRAASAVNVIGKVLSDPGLLRKAKDGVRVTLERA